MTLFPALPALSALSALLAALALPAPAPDGRPGGTAWPVAGPDGGQRPVIARLWEPPPTPWGAGHRGVDLATAPGSPVRAAAPGRVIFAGPVAGRGVLSIELDGTGSPPMRTTYEPVRPAVALGDRVRAGEVVGELAPGPFHCAGPCLHWGLLREERYLDPLTLLPPRLLRPGPTRLLPLDGVPVPRDGHEDGDAHPVPGHPYGGVRAASSRRRAASCGAQPPGPRGFGHPPLWAAPPGDPAHVGPGSEDRAASVKVRPARRPATHARRVGRKPR